MLVAKKQSLNKGKAPNLLQRRHDRRLGLLKGLLSFEAIPTPAFKGALTGKLRLSGAASVVEVKANGRDK